LLRKRATVLVVDDNRDDVRIVRDALRSKGYKVIAAYDGEKGFLKAQRTDPDIIILDIMMPKLDGIEVLRKIREHPELKTKPVIMLTAKTQDEDMLKGYRWGADYYITKPFTLSQLYYGVSMMLTRLRKEKGGS